MIMSLKQRKIKLNHNIYIISSFFPEVVLRPLITLIFLNFLIELIFFSVVTVKFLEPKCFKVDYHINCGEQGFPALRKAVST